MKGREERSWGMETLIADVLAKIKPTTPDIQHKNVFFIFNEQMIVNFVPKIGSGLILYLEIGY